MKNQEVKRDGKHILLNEINKKKGSINFVSAFFCRFY
jgi:hypothetical protein